MSPNATAANPAPRITKEAETLIRLLPSASILKSGNTTAKYPRAIAPFIIDPQDTIWNTLSPNARAAIPAPRIIRDSAVFFISSPLPNLENSSNPVPNAAIIMNDLTIAPNRTSFISLRPTPKAAIDAAIKNIPIPTSKNDDLPPPLNSGFSPLPPPLPEAADAAAVTSSISGSFRLLSSADETIDSLCKINKACNCDRIS